MKIDSCFIVYSPLHAFIVDILIKNYSLGHVLVYIPYSLEYKFESDVCVKEYYYAGTGVSKYQKLFYFILNYLTIKAINSSELFIPNDADPFVMLFEKKINYSRLNFIEEGVTAFSRLQHQKSPSTFQSNTNALKKLFKIDSNDIVLSSRKIERAFVFFSNKLKKIRPDIEYVELDDLIATTDILSGEDFTQSLKEFKGVDILIATSPFTENGHCDNFQEVEVIYDIVSMNINKSILLKLHYRDNIQKYRKIFDEFKNVRVLPDTLNSQPYQIMHSILRPKSIYAFHSSILFSVPSLGRDFKRVSMLKMINSPRSNAFYEGLVSVSAEFEDMYFVNGDGSLTTT